MVVSDTGPINYLILIKHIDLLPCMYERLVIPVAVQAELSNTNAPLAARRWIASPPVWLELVETGVADPVTGLHKGETAAIALAASLHADLLLMDERRGVRAAQSQGLRVTGTLGVLDLAAERGLVDFALAIRALESTSFRRPLALLETLLAKHRGSKNS